MRCEFSTVNDYVPGDIVEVRMAYRGSGHFAPDGDEGIYTVKRRMRDGNDYYLVRGWQTIADVAELDWDLIVHFQRLRRL